jgi:hypothetical protein
VIFTLCVTHARELGSSGVKSLLAVPISFVSEHIETLEEIDMEYRELAIESGITQASGELNYGVYLFISKSILLHPEFKTS